MGVSSRKLSWGKEMIACGEMHFHVEEQKPKERALPQA